MGKGSVSGVGTKARRGRGSTTAGLNEALVPCLPQPVGCRMQVQQAHLPAARRAAQNRLARRLHLPQHRCWSQLCLGSAESEPRSACTPAQHITHQQIDRQAGQAGLGTAQCHACRQARSFACLSTTAHCFPASRPHSAPSLWPTSLLTHLRLATGICSPCRSKARAARRTLKGWSARAASASDCSSAPLPAAPAASCWPAAAESGPAPCCCWGWGRGGNSGTESSSASCRFSLSAACTARTAGYLG